jgi:serine phosphatase RsbU (regulator of sigma subunit)
MTLINKIFLVTLLSVLFSLPRFVSAQQAKGAFLFDGLVYGYKHETSKKLLQKDKDILEGILQDVSISILENEKLVSTAKTNKKGGFELKLIPGKVYKIEFSKPSYTKSILMLDLRSVPEELASEQMTFTDAEIILNSFKAKDTAQTVLPFGKLFYNTKDKYIDFEPNRITAKKGIFNKHEEPNNAAYLMKRAVGKNKGNVIKLSRKVKKVNPAKTPDLATKSDSTSSGFKLAPNRGVENLKPEELYVREAEIQEARKQLAQDRLLATSPEDLLLIEERERLLNAAVMELEGAKKVISLQENEIALQKKMLWLSAFCVLLLLVFVYTLIRHNREKRLANQLLAEKTKKITDSINYASRIQQSILLEEKEVKKILPESFIFYAPKDIVSGDFYWLSEVENKTIVAAVDCTGHGVPGAFMSLIGNTLLNEIVNEKKITDPSEILNMMHVGVMKALRQNSDGHSQDGMEMSLCIIDKKSGKIEYAGAMNPVYILKNGEVNVVKPDVQSIGGINPLSNKAVEFSSQQLPIEKNMFLYMFSDGYMDQFGGPENKKFNTVRFKKMISNFSETPLDKQKEVVAQTINDWKGEQKQIDDMLVIGIKF